MHSKKFRSKTMVEVMRVILECTTDDRSGQKSTGDDISSDLCITFPASYYKSEVSVRNEILFRAPAARDAGTANVLTT